MKQIRVMTYNVRHLLGSDRRVDHERVARVIGLYRPDIVALQELDVGSPRTNGADQPRLIADALRMDCHFCAAFVVGDWHYGHALYSRFPMEAIRSAKLPTLTHRRIETRAALWASVAIGDTKLQVFTTHLGLLGSERILQADALLGEEWLGSSACKGPIVLMGDFNSWPGSRAYRRFAGRLVDAQRAARGVRPRPTFPSRLSVLRIDHVFVSREVTVQSTLVPKTPLVRAASDHRPVVVDLELPSVASYGNAHAAYSRSLA